MKTRSRRSIPAPLATDAGRELLRLLRARRQDIGAAEARGSLDLLLPADPGRVLEVLSPEDRERQLDRETDDRLRWAADAREERDRIAARARVIVEALRKPKVRSARLAAQTAGLQRRMAKLQLGGWLSRSVAARQPAHVSPADLCAAAADALRRRKPEAALLFAEQMLAALDREPTFTNLDARPLRERLQSPIPPRPRRQHVVGLPLPCWAPASSVGRRPAPGWGRRGNPDLARHGALVERLRAAGAEQPEELLALFGLGGSSLASRP